MQFPVSPARATDEIQVYNAEITPVHTWYLQQHLNYVWQGSMTPDFEGGFASNRTLNGTPELAYGVTDWYEMGWYLPFAVDSNGTFLPGGLKFRHLFVSPHADERRFFYGLNIELSYQSPRFSENPFMVEFRPIIGVRDLGWEFIANPIVDVSAGPTGTAEFTPALRLAHTLGNDIWVGAEYYANVGPIGNVLPADEQQHTLYGVVDFRVLGFDVQLGAGAGLTSGSDGFATKLIIGHRLN
jgi:hypothetical protein